MSIISEHTLVDVHYIHKLQYYFDNNFFLLQIENYLAKVDK
jgi:hypothetical protein